MLLKQKLNDHYPTLKTNKDMCYSALIISLLVYFFLSVFQPFGTFSFQHTYKYLMLLAYPIIAFIFFFSAELIVYKLYNNWNWKKEIYKHVFVLFFCSPVNYAYLITVINQTSFSIIACLYMVLFTFVMGVPICVINVLAKYIFVKNREVNNLSHQKHLDLEGDDTASVVISPDSGSQISILKDDFCYAQSEGNYSLLNYWDNDKFRRKLIRLSLKNLEKQIGDDIIFRCHRSYILNSDKIETKEGNSQGFKVYLKNIEDKISVSRNYIYKLKEK